MWKTKMESTWAIKLVCIFGQLVLGSYDFDPTADEISNLQYIDTPNVVGKFKTSVASCQTLDN